MDNVSIVMATYNGEKYLREQIESILSSTYKDFELHITDDGSQDKTMEILEQYRRKYPDKIHIKRNEANMGAARNFLNAVMGMTSEYIMLCDHDDVWRMDKIARAIKRVKQMEVQFGKDTPIAVFTDAYVTDENLNIIHDSFFRSCRLNPRLTDLPHLLMENKLIGCTVMINQAVLRILQSGPLPARVKFHDHWLGLIAASAGRIGFIKEPTMLYRQHGSNVVGNRGYISYVADRVSNIRKQRKSLMELYMQAEEFAFLYGSHIEKGNLEIIRNFSRLHQYNFIKRRIMMIRYGYLKSGILRNIGLMIIA